MQNTLTAELAAANECPASLARFTATLLPAHSLPREGFRALLFNIAAMSYLSVIAFVALGGWSLPYLWGLDAAVCYAAYRWRYGTGHLCERVELTEQELCVTRIHPSGERESWNFNPYWVRLEHGHRQESGNELWLSSHGRELVFGAFLSDSEKASFAAALGAALASQRGHTVIHQRGL
jgi:uncharacterized membrane protein